ncbi:Tll0287-like domain-containing protein [Dissulfurispira thermophila]|uniref:Tll0287-like domain-containing protein n=1 Tax=Dissulfurispira thermophila TaxID=2715679 RepID=UPI00193D70FF|nr:DUF3365 domain-containing protein [Dissulfurispira thermophila]
MRKFFSEINKVESPCRLSVTFLVPFVIILGLLFFALILWEKKSHDEKLFNILKESASALFDQIMVTRLWNAKHGGVYVEVTPDTPPNPYLEDPMRDIVSVDGRHYTKINPAYMTRQLSEITMQRQGYKFSIVSLNPINPFNIPDDWEKKALKEFESNKIGDYAEILQQGSPENRKLSWAGRSGSRIFRYIGPLKTEAPCLKCHAKHGYNYGDIRGGISISIPMDRYDLIYSADFRKTIFSLLTIAVISVIFVAVITIILSRKLSSAIEKDIERKRLEAIVELAGATAHEMRQPMTIVHNIISLFRDKFRHQEPLTEEEMNIIEDQCNRMNNIIKKMMNITAYRTKDYVKGKKIIDLEQSSRNEDRE